MAFFGNKMMVFESILDPNLILDMKFHNNIIDDTGKSTASSYGITFENGVFSGYANNSVRIDSETDHITIVDSDLFTFADSFSDRPFKIEFDFIPHNLGTGTGGFYSKFIIHKRGLIGSTTISNSEWQIRTSNSQNEPKLEFFLFDELLGGIWLFRGSTTLLNGTSYNVSIVYDGVGDVEIIINNSIENITKEVIGNYSMMRNTLSKLRIGSTSFSPRQYALYQNLENLKIWKY